MLAQNDINLKPVLLAQNETNLSENNASVRTYELDETTVVGRADAEVTKYQSGTSVSRQKLDAVPSGNGDITSVLKMLPNVQFDNAALQSTTPGEIDPAKISISGGLHYQNLFTLDGIGMNNDLNPAEDGNYYRYGTGSNSQGLSIDISLLESITVQDSNVAAAYGGFTGGVVEAKTRRPAKPFGATFSYQFTQGNANPDKFSLTKYHIYGNEADLQDFLNSYSNLDKVENSPIFTKHLFRASFESQINEKFGLIASFASTWSFMPINKSNESTAGQRTQKRNINNIFLKAFYNPSDDLSTELSYAYAPTNEYRFRYNTPDSHSYDWNSGGHQVGNKIMWNNPLGLLTSTLSYSYLQNSATANGYEHSKYWSYSAAKNWASIRQYQREGGHPSMYSSQHTFNEKLVQDFEPFRSVSPYAEVEATFQVGLEVGYQKAKFGYPNDYISASGLVPMNATQQALCQNTDKQWCDTSVTYDYSNWNRQSYWRYGSDGVTPYYDGVDPAYLTDGTVTEHFADNYVIYNYGQYFSTFNVYSAGEKAIDNAYGALFLQEDLKLDFKKLGELNLRPGLRFDIDSYMRKFTVAPRFSLNYVAPIRQDFRNQITIGLNRYYGRNIFWYSLNDSLMNWYKDVIVSKPISTDEMYNILQNGVSCPDGTDTTGEGCVRIGRTTRTKFTELKVPYVDEFMVGIAQRIKAFDFSVKYIYRAGKDEIRYGNNTTLGLPPETNDRYYSMNYNYYTYTNLGKSWTNVVTFTIENNTPLMAFGTANHFLLAFDWTQVNRNYTDYTTSLNSSLDMQDEYIIWNGEFMRWSERPADNYVRPWTLRLNTTTTFSLGATKWLWNNFFRYRAGYEATAYSNLSNVVTPDGRTVSSVRNYKVQRAPASFTWDMRVGFEVDIYKGNTFFMNVDILNILDKENIAFASLSYNTDDLTPTYEVGRQFWLQVGYKY